MKRRISNEGLCTSPPEEYKGDCIKLVELTLNLRPLEAAKYIVGEGAIPSTTRPQSSPSMS